MKMRELAVPLQALLAVLTCISLMWMVYTMAFFNPNPPTAAEVHSLGTQGSNMQVYKTAAAMTVEALLFGPTDVLLPVTGPQTTPTPTATFRSALSTLVALPTQTSLASTQLAARTATQNSESHPIAGVPTSTPMTPTLTAVPTHPPTATTRPSETPTDEPPPTATLNPPTATSEPPTSEPPTATSEPPTSEPPTDVPTDPPPTDPPTEPAVPTEATP